MADRPSWWSLARWRGINPLIADGLLAVGLTLAGIASLAAGTLDEFHTRPGDAAGYLITVVGMGALAWRRQAPFAVFCVTIAANVAYVVAANQGASLEHYPPFSWPGGSMVVDYDGRILAQADPGPGEKIVVAPIDLAALRAERDRRVGHHMLAHLRTEAYRHARRPVYPGGRAGVCSEQTAYGFLCRNGMLVPGEVMRIRDATDGTSNTLIVVESSGRVAAVPNQELRGNYVGGWAGYCAWAGGRV